MPQFYFDTNGGSALPFVDAAGLAFVSLTEARAHAMSLLPVMGVELPMTPGEFRSWTVIVRDDADVIVCRLIMAIINDDLAPGAARVLRPLPKP